MNSLLPVSPFPRQPNKTKAAINATTHRSAFVKNLDLILITVRRRQTARRDRGGNQYWALCPVLVGIPQQEVSDPARTAAAFSNTMPGHIATTYIHFGSP